MKTNLQTSKGILAKLLATENITVTHQNVKTAYFDLKSRTMTLPVWQDMDGDLYDLLTGHEVGHALNTPQQGWHNEVAESTRKFKDFLNVIEDARIEKLVKRKFPGLSKSFSRAYASLYDRDFFGIKQLGDLSKLNLIDRINLRFKLGSHVVVEFNDAERAIVREIEAAETWEQVVDIARRVYDYVKENEQEKIQNKDDLDEQIQEEKEEQQQAFGDSGDDEDESDEETEEETEEFDDEAEGSASDESQESQGSVDQEEDEENQTGFEQSTRTGGGSDDSDEEPHSVTDQNFRAREQELVNETGEVYIFELPDPVLENIILPNTEVVNDLERFIQREVADAYKPYGRNGISYEKVVEKCVRRFNNENKKVILHILKEFEMRKKASEYSRSQTARTGELNMNVLHKYKFSNDLFRKITVVPKGKNHGIMMYVDMSGSMSNILRNTIDQMLILASFCKLAKIPFEAYGFSDKFYYNRKLMEMRSNQQWIYNNGIDAQVVDKDFHLKHLIGTSLSNVQYRKAFGLLCVVSNEYYRSSHEIDSDYGRFDGWESGGFGLNGTPTLPMLLASREMIRRFQNKHQVDVCNVVHLTDGAGSCTDIAYPLPTNIYYKKGPNIYIVDKKTKKKIKIRDTYSAQTQLTELVADVTGCKHIGFYIGNKRDIKYYLKGSGLSMETQQNARKSFNKDGFFTIESQGYEKYFFVGVAEGNVKDEKLQITQDMSKNKMAKVFSENLETKRTNRFLLNSLASELAVA